MFYLHYYVGIERVSAKTQTLRVIGSFPQKLLASEMPNLNIAAVRDASTTSVTDAGAIVTGVYNKFGMTPPPLQPIVENNRTESFHDPAKLNISYFHPDHLGSSSYITNTSGIVTQHLEYMTFGEVFVEEHRNSFNSRFKFNEGRALKNSSVNCFSE